MPIGERIKQLRLTRNMTQQELADRLGTSKQAIHKYEYGIVTNIPLDRLEQLAAILGTDVAYLTGWEKHQNDHDSAVDSLLAKHTELFRPKMKKVPLLGGIACGEPIFSPNIDEEFALINEDIAVDFALVCKGDSMKDAGINDGDIIYIRKQEIVDNGQIAAIVIGEEVTLKRVYYYREKNKLVLQPANPDYEPLVYTGYELEEIRILGKAVAQLRRIR